MTIEEITSDIAEKVRTATPLAASQWLDYASQLNVLMMDVEDELVVAEMGFNALLSKSIVDNPEESVSKLKAIAKGSDENRRYLELKAKKENVTEFIRLAKKRIELAVWDR